VEQAQQQESTKVSSRTTRRRSRKEQLTPFVDIVVGLSIFVLGWQIVYWLKVWPPFLFPSPSTTLGEFVTLVKTGMLQSALVSTLERMGIDFGLTLVLGFAVGIVMVRFKRFGKTMASFCVGLQSFPSLAWVPFAILIIGLNDLGILFVVVISSIFSVMMSTYSGLRNTPAIYVRAAKNMGTGGLPLFTSVMIPAAMPSLISGVRQAWSFAWHALIGAEMLMGAIGLGGILYFGSEFNRMDQVIASMVVIFIIGLLADRLLFFRLEERVRNTWGLNRPA
jgi:NitT/TauT family transport system permease protein